eukprot:TRINITY_DN8161_c3_g1_i1.p1 TRINITY_DN8161_c3_g1~~TRINITY_DN8161_c3_g1_i1.p1  ORF type:complete len:228 (+),score=63.45 TRINITY_DN8161_c3_g1_i1:90-773(+)
MLRRCFTSQNIKNVNPSMNKINSYLFSSTSKQNDEIIEYRTYTVHPEHFPNFIAMTNKEIHNRTKYSKLLGYFMTEIGGQNEVVHFWSYESLAARQKVREALVKDEDWMNNYMANMRPMLQKQENTIIRNIKSTSLDKPHDNASQSVFLLADSIANNDNTENRNTLRENGGRLIGDWNYNSTDENGLELWHFDNLSQIDNIIPLDGNSDKTVYLKKIMFPTPFSPWK